MSEDARPSFGVGFGLSGLLAAGLAYLAFDWGLASGPPWLAALAAIAIGATSAAVMLAVDRAIRRPPSARGRPVKLRGPWACPECGAAYVPDATECSDCHVPLVGVRE